MTATIKTFDELTNRELYEILKLRSQVFIVEQGGCYLEMDDIDYESTHIFYRDADGSILGCIRIFPKEDEPGVIQLGRLVTKNRRTGLGRQLMANAEAIARERYAAKGLYLTGRPEAHDFYLKCGYYDATTGPWGYDEMRKTL